MFADMKISYKLMLNTGLLIFFLLGVGYIYSTANLKLEKTHEELIKQDLEIEFEALEIESKMLQARRNEKDFLMRLDPKYLERHKKTMSELRYYTGNIAKISKEINGKEITQLITKVGVQADIYEKSFHKVYDLWVTRGLDHKSGIQGEFRTLIKGMEAEFKAYQTEHIYLDLLQIRRYEKDYQRTIGQAKNAKYFTKLNTAIDNFLKHSSEISFSAENAKLITGLVEGYKQAFKLYNDAIASGDKAIQEKEYENIRKAAHDIEGFIKANYIPDVSSKLLTIRRKEKDYLLRHQDPVSAEKYTAGTHKAVANLQADISASELPDDKKAHFKGLLDNYGAMFTSLTDADLSIKAGIAEMRAAVHAIEPLIRGDKEKPGMTLLARKIAEDKAENIKIEAEESNGFAKFLTFLAAAIGLVLSIVINKSLNNPLQKVLESTKRLASKDLTVQLDLQRNDELGEMATSLDGAISNLNNQMQTIQSSSSTLKTSVDSIGDSAQEISNSMVAAGEDASMVESVSDTMSKNMEKVSKETDLLSEQSMEVSMKATEIA
ncbi:MAG: methyl-accepting chemotaxis protein, partial [Lentisphaeraceae bacterium]|nr:methyl-accepting chemotaxis protein [Lentisphaeraceae bacterium]